MSISKDQEKPAKPDVDDGEMDETDEALADSFPASDPPSQSVPTVTHKPSQK